MPEELMREVMMLLGFKPGQHNNEASSSIACAYDMGYRRPDDLAAMARKMLFPPQA